MPALLRRNGLLNILFEQSLNFGNEGLYLVLDEQELIWQLGRCLG